LDAAKADEPGQGGNPAAISCVLRVCPTVWTIFKAKGMKTKSSKRSQPDQSRTLLGQILVELGYITIYQLDEALNIQRGDAESGNEQKPLGQILLELGYCTPNQLIRGIQVQVEYRKAQVTE
jgi:hypothetical protein